MFLHNFKYSFKTLIRSKMLLFWTFAFPILLGTFFQMAFSDIEKKEQLSIIPIAIVESEEFQQNTFIRQALDNLSDKQSDHALFTISYTSLVDAQKRLTEETIDGYLQIKNKQVTITVKENGINQTILRYVLDEIQSNRDIVQQLAEQKIAQEQQNGKLEIDYENIYKEAMLLTRNNDIKLNDISSQNLSYTMIEFYTLIAMTCLYGGILSMFVINYKLANMGSVGKRTSIAPIKKGSVVLGSLMASYVVQLIGVLLLFLYTVFLLKVNYGTQLPQIILLALVGSFAGLTMGVAVGTLIKTNENTKTGILIAVTMVGSFLSGMMGITMKYIIDKNIPFLNQLNPASMITDGFYALYYYHTPERYLYNIISLLIFSFLMIFLSYRSLRRQKYDSI